MTSSGHGGAQGVAIRRLASAGTVAFVAVTAAAVLASGLRPVAVGVDLVLFLAGLAVMLATVVVAAGRSRHDEIGIGGLFFLAGTAPRRVALELQANLAVQVVVALAGAAARPYTGLAFGVLVPVWGLGFMGLWGARHGRFGSRRTPTAG